MKKIISRLLSKAFNLRSKIKKPLCKEISGNAKLWFSKKEFDEMWKQRISLMASYIDIIGPVADFGCGLMWLEPMLGKDNDYIPLDYIKRDERTIVIDFNKEELPEIKAAVGFLSGVLEYIKDIKSFSLQLCKLNLNKIILSYCTIEQYSNMDVRHSLNWVSHESIFDLISYFTDSYNLIKISDINKNTILVFEKK